MTWAGLDSSTLAIGAGALALALTLLHLLRVRRRTLWVAHAPLWFALESEGRANALLRRLRRLWSLLLLLTIAAALLTALGDPRPTEGSLLGFAPEKSPPVRHTMLLIDTSASMDTQEGGETRFERAIEEARELLARLGSNPGQRVMVAAVGRRVTPMTLWSKDMEVIGQALDELLAQGPGDEPMDAAKAHRTVQSVLSGRAGSEAVLFTDGAFDPGETPYAFQARVMGSRSSNLSIEAFNVRPALDGSSTYGILATVRNHLEVPVKATLLLYAREDARSVEEFVSPHQIVTSRELEVPAQGVRRVVLNDVLFSGDRLAARVVLDPTIETLDGLARDDVAVALVPPRRRLRVQLVGPDDLFVSASLLTLEGIELETRSAQEYRGPEGFDVTVLHRAQVDLSAPGNYLLIDPPSGATIQHHRSVKRPRIASVNGKHPVTRGLEFVDASIERASVIESRAGDQVLVRAHGGTPLVFTRELDDGQRRLLVLAFAPKESLFPLRYAFPLMIVQSLGWFSPQAQGLVPTRRTGTSLSIATRLPPGPVQVRGPGVTESARVRRIGDRLHFVGDRVGIYEFSTDAPGAKELIALNLMDGDESRLDDRAQLQPYSAPAPWSPPERPWPGTPWRLLLLLACGLLIVEWWTWHRRITA